jgi:UDP-N-acetylglucosamine 2-epimerase (non-hydrolysing)
MRNIVFVAGARPNFMKVAPIMRELAAREGKLLGELVHTGQHYDYAMSGVFFEQLGLKEPDVHLQVGSGSHGVQTGSIMVAFEKYLLGRSSLPHGVVVVGDVNSTMASALVASKLRIPVVHVEAGLRSFDRAMPEEINRVVTDALADLLLVSEPAGMENLAREGIAPERIQFVGNVMIDSLVAQLAAARALNVPHALGLPRNGYALVTLHRPSNVDDSGRLAFVVRLLSRLATVLPVVFPVHPRTRKMLDQGGLGPALERAGVRMCDAMGYREFLGVMEGARLVLSDSGGIQEETTFLGIPCITLRSTTERPVTVSAGTNTLVGDDLELAWEVFERAREAPRRVCEIEGWDGKAAQRIVDSLINWG